MRSQTKARSLQAKAACGLAAAIALAACGRTVALGDDNMNTGEAGGTDGTEGSAGNSGSSASPDGAVGASAAAGGDGGASGGSMGSGGADDVDGGTCKVPRPVPTSNPTTAERERAELVRAFCSTLAQYGCIEHYDAQWITPQATGCSVADKVRACEQDELYLYRELVPEECDDEWRAVMRCAATPEYARACREPVSRLGGSERVPGSEPGLCDVEMLALATCRANASSRVVQVTGARTTCSYYRGAQFTTCVVTCVPPTGIPGQFLTTCEGPPGLPLNCPCMVNGSMILSGSSFFASDCQHAAKLMADGLCVDRLDCCFTAEDLGGGRQCGCSALSSDPPQTCEAMAADRGGKVVDICPKYLP
jgi:hypothetical protein